MRWPSAFPILSALGATAAPACELPPPSSYTAELARKSLSGYAMVIDGVVTEPMRITPMGPTPATIRVTNSLKGPKVRSIQVHYVTNCDEVLMAQGERLSIALLRTESLGSTGIPLSVRMRLLFRGKLGDLAERLRLLFTTRQVLVLEQRADGDRPFDREIRRLLRQKLTRVP